MEKIDKLLNWFTVYPTSVEALTTKIAEHRKKVKIGDVHGTTISEHVREMGECLLDIFGTASVQTEVQYIGLHNSCRQSHQLTQNFACQTKDADPSFDHQLRHCRSRQGMD